MHLSNDIHIIKLLILLQARLTTLFATPASIGPHKIGGWSFVILMIKLKHCTSNIVAGIVAHECFSQFAWVIRQNPKWDMM